MKGRVKWWNTSKGCGFIELNAEDSIFISLAKEDKESITIEEDQLIEFEVVNSPKGNILKIINLQKSETLSL